MEIDCSPPESPEGFAAGWVFDHESCTAEHTSGLKVRFLQSDTMPNAVVGEMVDIGLNENPARLLQQAAMLYTQLRRAQH